MTAKNPTTAKSYAPGQYLFHEGEPSDSMFLIQKGTVAIRKYKGNTFVELARLYSNEVLGELSFFDRLPRSATAVALTEVEILELSFDALDRVYANVPDYFRAIMASVADRLRRANDTIRRLQKSVATDSAALSRVKMDTTSTDDIFAGLSDEDLDSIPNDIPATSRSEGDPEES